VACPVCEERGCPECGGRGTFELASCPAEFAGDDAWEVLEAAEAAAKGLPPVAGGLLDQAAAFSEAARFVWAEQRRHRAELRLPLSGD